MLEFEEDILPSPPTPLVLPPPVPQPVCAMQTPALFMMTQSFSQPQSVDTANYARVRPLPSPATSSSSSGEHHLYIDTDTSSPSVPVGPQNSSQQLSLQGDSHVPQPLPLFSTTHRAVSSQPPPQPTSIPTWADEVATVEQSGRSTPETFVPNWAYTERIREPRPQSQPLVYPPPVMSTPHTSLLIIISSEQFWQQSKYFFALADRPNYYLNAFLTQGTLRNFDPIKYYFII